MVPLVMARAARGLSHAWASSRGLAAAAHPGHPLESHSTSAGLLQSADAPSGWSAHRTDEAEPAGSRRLDDARNAEPQVAGSCNPALPPPACGSHVLEQRAMRALHAEEPLSANRGGPATSSTSFAPCALPAESAWRGGPGAAWRRQPGRKRVAVALSGGVDSAVAAMLLKQQGHEVVGVFMHNWDAGEEGGRPGGCSEADLAAAQCVAAQLHIPLLEADFTQLYWHSVFADFVAQMGRGLTPNPDLACNRHIKFGALLAWATERGADVLASGHYARLRPSPDGGPPQLLRGADPAKDQSYFLASVPGEALARASFPLGGLLKGAVRRLAAEAGLAPAARRSSAGICFIGRRKFAQFLEGYAAPRAGRYVDVDSGADRGPCANLAAVTYGQHASVGGAEQRLYVAGKDVVGARAWVAAGRWHPALFTDSALAGAPHWVAGVPPPALAAGRPLRCHFMARRAPGTCECTCFGLWYRQVARECTVVPAGTVGALEPSSFCRLLPEDAAAAAAAQANGLQVRFGGPVRAVTPQQALVLYAGEVCLGAAAICHPGPTHHERGLAVPAAAARVEDCCHEKGVAGGGLLGRGAAADAAAGPAALLWAGNAEPLQSVV